MESSEKEYLAYDGTDRLSLMLQLYQINDSEPNSDPTPVSLEREFRKSEWQQKPATKALKVSISSWKHFSWLKIFRFSRTLRRST